MPKTKRFVQSILRSSETDVIALPWMHGSTQPAQDAPLITKPGSTQTNTLQGCHG